MRTDDEEDDGRWPSWSETDDVGKGVYIGAAFLALLILDKVWSALFGP